MINNNMVYTSGDDNLLMEIDFIDHKIMGVYETKPSRQAPILVKNNLLTNAIKSITPKKIVTDNFECDLAYSAKLKHLAVTHKKG